MTAAVIVLAVAQLATMIAFAYHLVHLRRYRVKSERALLLMADWMLTINDIQRVSEATWLRSNGIDPQ